MTGTPSTLFNRFVKPVLEDLDVFPVLEPPVSVTGALNRTAVPLQFVSKLCVAAEIDVSGLLPDAVQNHCTTGDDLVILPRVRKGIQLFQNVSFVHSHHPMLDV